MTAAADRAPAAPTWPPSANAATRLVLLVFAAALSGLSFLVAFNSDGFAVPVLATAAIGVVLATAARTLSQRRRRSALIVTGIDVAGFVLLAVVMGRTISPTTLAEPLLNGWARILTSSVPIDATFELLLPVLAVVWIVAVAGVELSLRRSSPAAPALPALVATALGLTFGAADGLQRFGTGPMALLVLVLGGLLLVPASRDRPGSGLGLRRAGAGFAVLAAIAIVAAVVGPNLPIINGRAPQLLRDHLSDPPRPRPGVNPIALVAGAARDSAQARADGRDLPVAFTADSSTPVERYRLASLDQYDGVQWHSDEVYQRTGHELPDATATASAGTTTRVHQHIHINDVGGYWLPTAYRPVTTSLDKVLFDPVSATIVSADASSAGLTYDVESDVPNVSDADLAGASIAQGDTAAPYLQLPPGDLDSIRGVADQALRGTTSQYQQVAQLQAYLRQHYQLLPAEQTQPGHSLVVLKAFLTDPKRQQASPEQFAAAFALLARLSGIPARVVVGYRVDPTQTNQNVPADALTVWPEVLFEDYGWVPFDPTPSATGAGASADIPDAGGAGGTDGGGSTPTGGTLGADQSGSDPSTPLVRTATMTAERLFGWALLAIAVLVGLVITLVAVTAWLRRRLRRRRTSGDPRNRVIGAWSDILDHLAERGAGPTAPLTATEVVQVAHDVIGPDAARTIKPVATLVNEARYRTRPPSAEVADRAWRHAGAFEARCAKSLNRRQQLRRHVDPRPQIRSVRDAVTGGPRPVRR